MDYFVSHPLEIKNQEKGDECVSCAISSMAEDILNEPIDASYLYNKTQDGQFGAIPKKVCQGAIDFGLLPFGSTTPVKLFTNFHSVWCFNYFNGIKSTLVNKKKTVLTGCFWQPEWTKLPGGIIDGWYQNLNIFPHAFKCFGFKEINGIMYLAIQNSMGKDVGDGGVFYFPEEIAQKFQFAYYFDY